MKSTIQSPPRGRPRLGVILACFAYLWLMVGLFSGTAVLIGPVQWITRATQAAGVGQASEDVAVKAVILLFVVGSFLASRWLLRQMFGSGRRSVRFGIPAVVTLAAGLSLVAWMNPGRMLASMAGGSEGEVQLASGAEFLFGPYPDRDRLQELKREGVTAVVSLQHPAVPIEVPGIKAERETAAELGLEFIHAPMLPWVSENDASLETIRKLVREGRGKYYVHCGLGRDRANMVRRLVENTGIRTRTSDDFHAALTFADRKRQALEGEVPSEAFERGKLLELEPGVWLIPYPNRRELFGYMLAGQVEHVISLLDPADAEQAEWASTLRQLLAQQKIGLTEVPLAAGDTATARALTEQLRRLPRPVAVIAPRTPWTDYQRPGEGAEVATTFYRAHARATGK